MDAHTDYIGPMAQDVDDVKDMIEHFNPRARGIDQKNDCRTFWAPRTNKCLTARGIQPIFPQVHEASTLYPDLIVVPPVLTKIRESEHAWSKGRRRRDRWLSAQGLW